MRFSSAILGVVAAGLQCPTILLAQGQRPRPLIERLDPETRASVILALAALTMLGFLLIAITWLGFRIVRRWHRDAEQLTGNPSRPRTSEHDWASKPLRPDDPA